MNKLKLLIFPAIVLSTLLLALVFLKSQDNLRPVNFELQGTKGVVRLSDFKGKYVILYFGFVTCPDVCPMSLTKLSQELDKLTPEMRAKLHPIFISVDWKRDTPQMVHEYAGYFGKDIIGLTGSEEQINKTIKVFHAYYKFVDLKKSALKYTVDHSSRFYLISPEGQLMRSFQDIEHNEEFIKYINQLL